MVLPANASIFERCQLIQRDVVGDLPALNESGSPKLGTFCRLNDGTYWCVVVSDVAPPHNLIWEQIGVGGAGLLPDQRFTVGRGTYNLNPNPATFTTIAAGVAAALAGTGTTLGAASSASQRFVWILPDQYAEAITLQPYVHLEGAGGAAESSRLIGNVTYNGGNGYVVVRNVHFTGSTINVAPTAGSKLVLVFENCTFEGVTWSLTTLGGDAPTDVTLLFNGCEGQIVSATFTVAAGDLLVHQYVGLPSTGTGSFAANRGIRFESTPTYTGAGGVVVGIMGGQRLIANGAGGPMLRFTGTVTGSVVTDDCLLYTGNLQASVFGNTSANMATWLCRSGSRVAITPRSYWNTSTSAHFEGGQLEVLIPTTNDASAPLDAISGGTVTSSLYPSNRQRFVQDFNFSVPASQAGGGGPYGSAAAAVAAMTVNNLLGINAYADTYRIVVDYTGLNADPVDPASANFATTFRYASFLLKDPTLLEDGRLYVVKNDTNPNGNGAGPIALRLPNGTSANIEHLVSDASVNGTFTTVDYVILNPGQAVILEVDRDSPSAPAYAVIAVVDALPGIPPAPDQRFTVGKAAYALNGPGTNTWLTPEDAIAAAQAGTGTTLGPASTLSPRVVWIMPDRYTGPQVPVALEPNVHLLGAAVYDKAVTLVSYAFDFANAGRISLRGIRFSGCSFSVAPTGDSQIEFTECEFVNCTWSSTNGDVPVSTYRFIRCHGSFASHVDTLSTNAQIYKQFDGGDSTDGAGIGVGPTISFGASMEVNGVGGQAFIAISCGQRLTPPNGQPMLLVADNTSASVSTRECLIGSSVTTSVMKSTSTGFIEWVCGAGTTLTELPFSYFDTVGPCTFVGNELCITGSTSYPTGGSPLNPVSGGTVDSSLNFASNRQRATQTFDFNVPAAGATVAAQTVNNAVVTNAYADEYRIKTTYQGGFVLQPNTAIPASFQFASFVLTDPQYLEDGREVVVKNTSDVTANGSSVALRLPNGTTSRIDYKNADISVNPVFNNTNFIILAAGDHVRLSVDRSTPGTARYLVTG